MPTSGKKENFLEVVTSEDTTYLEKLKAMRLDLATRVDAIPKDNPKEVAQLYRQLRGVLGEMVAIGAFDDDDDKDDPVGQFRDKLAR